MYPGTRFQTMTENSGLYALLQIATRDEVRLVPHTTLWNGRFQITKRLGYGGMGIVYEATDNLYSTRIALKTLFEPYEMGIARLKQEFRGLAGVVHPNLVGLYELFVNATECFYTMELVPGETLQNALESALDTCRIIQVFSQLALGIQAVHAAGKLHRDLKPSNVMLTPEGRVVILDFGLVSDPTHIGSNLDVCKNPAGTPAYMAPEQIAGKPASVHSDWYAFGVMLYEALQGKRIVTEFSYTKTRRTRSKKIPYLPIGSTKPTGPKNLVDLCTQLLLEDPNKRPGYEEIARALRLPDSSIGLQPPKRNGLFVGRIPEMKLLHTAYDGMRRSQTVIACVHSVSGMGKTALVERFLSDLQTKSNLLVLTGRCYEQESMPYKTCESLFDQLGRFLYSLPKEKRADFIPDRISALARIFPALGFLDSNKIPNTCLPRDPNEIRHWGFEAAKQLLANIAKDKPVVVFVDDLQWSDVDGAMLLGTLFTPPAPALMFIGAFRSDGPASNAGLSQFLHRITSTSDRNNIYEFRLDRLDAQDAHTFADSLLPAESKLHARHIALESKGNPYLITELVQHISLGDIEHTQPDLDQAVSRRISTLPLYERAVLYTICVHGIPIDHRMLLASQPTPNLASCLHTLCNSLLTRRVSGPVSKITWYHDRIRESVIASLSPTQLRYRHRRLARALEGSPNPDPFMLVHHLIGAGEHRHAGSIAKTAAKQAMQSLAFDNAAELLQIALEHNPGDFEQRRDLQIELGEALAHAGHCVKAAQSFTSAAHGAPREQSLELHQQAAQQWLKSGHMRAGFDELNRVLQTVGLKLHKTWLGSLVDLTINRLRLYLRGLDYKTGVAKTVSKTDLLRLRASESAVIGLWSADTLQSAAFCARYLRLSLDSGIAEYIAKGFSTEAVCRSIQGVNKRTIVNQFIQKAQLLLAQIEDPETKAHVNLTIGMAIYIQGELIRAMPYLKSAENTFIHDCTRKSSLLDITHALMGLAYQKLGHWSTLCDVWDDWVADAVERGNLYHTTVCQTWPMGCCRYLAKDDPQRARMHLEQGIRQWPWHAYDLQHMQTSISEAMIHRYEGDFFKAYENSMANLKRLRRTPLWFVQMHRSVSMSEAALSILGLAVHTKNRIMLLQKAIRLSVRLEKESFPITQAYVPYIRACVTYLDGDKYAAVGFLSTAIKAFEVGGYKLQVAALKRHLGHIIRGDNGYTLIRQTDAVMNTEGIRNKDRIISMLAPGFDQ